jgi:hypothetical protein
MKNERPKRLLVVLRKKKSSILNDKHMESLSATVDMNKKKKFFLVFLFIVTTLGLLLALVPVQDIDADGSSDSLVTEGMLAASVVSTFLALLHLSTRFISIPLASPWLLSFLLILPPITTL